MGLAALRHMGSSQTRDRTCVSCIARWTLIHCTTREVFNPLFFLCHFLSFLLFVLFSFLDYPEPLSLKMLVHPFTHPSIHLSVIHQAATCKDWTRGWKHQVEQTWTWFLSSWSLRGKRASVSEYVGELNTSCSPFGGSASPLDAPRCPVVRVLLF